MMSGLLEEATNRARKLDEKEVKLKLKETELKEREGKLKLEMDLLI